MRIKPIVLSVLLVTFGACHKIPPQITTKLVAQSGPTPGWLSETRKVDLGQGHGPENIQTTESKTGYPSPKHVTQAGWNVLKTVGHRNACGGARDLVRYYANHTLHMMHPRFIQETYWKEYVRRYGKKLDQMRVEYSCRVTLKNAVPLPPQSIVKIVPMDLVSKLVAQSGPAPTWLSNSGPFLGKEIVETDDVTTGLPAPKKITQGEWNLLKTKAQAGACKNGREIVGYHATNTLGIKNPEFSQTGFWKEYVEIFGNRIVRMHVVYSCRVALLKKKEKKNVDQKNRGTVQEGKGNIHGVGASGKGLGSTQGKVDGAKIGA